MQPVTCHVSSLAPAAEWAAAETANPVVALRLIIHWIVTQSSWLSVGLILLATALLIPELKFGKKARQAGALVQEVSE